VWLTHAAACHAGGKNIVVPARTLSKEDIGAPSGLGKFTLEAIIYQVAASNSHAITAARLPCQAPNLSTSCSQYV